MRDSGVEKMLLGVVLCPWTDSFVSNLVLFDSNGGTESSVISHGQKYIAAIVNVVSKEFENVLVDTNHCHGLSTVMKSYCYLATISISLGLLTYCCPCSINFSAINLAR